MSRTARTLRLAKKVAPTEFRQNMVAIIAKGGKIIASSVNNMEKTHPTTFNGQYSRCVHAEISAIHRATNISNIKGSDIYIYRFLKNGTLGNSKPCNSCMEAIKKANIKYMTYYQEGQMLTERVIHA